MTLLFGLLGFALGALAGIVALAALNAAGSPYNMQLALRVGALPGAALGMIAGVVMTAVFERRAKPAGYSH
jgi:hypothetical protein